MRKIIASEWMTLDGIYDGSTVPQWFVPYHSDARGEWIGQGINNADAFLLGRNTYQMLAPHWSRCTNNEDGVAAQLNALPKYVVSSTMETAEWNNSTIISANAIDEIAALKQQSSGYLFIMGSGMLVHSLLAAGLVDELRVLIQPIIFGEGKRLFQDGIAKAALTLAECQQLPLGVLSLTYKPAS